MRHAARFALFPIVALTLALAAVGCGGDIADVSSSSEADTPFVEVDDSSETGTIVAEARFVHDGFRTEVSRVLSSSKPGDDLDVSIANGEAQVIVVSLWNLSDPASDLSSRATINFAEGLNNFVVVPTADGPLTLHLHRDGTLRTTPDNGGFT